LRSSSSLRFNDRRRERPVSAFAAHVGTHARGEKKFDRPQVALARVSHEFRFFKLDAAQSQFAPRRLRINFLARLSQATDARAQQRERKHAGHHSSQEKFTAH
jgi:hypothetical protein